MNFLLDTNVVSEWTKPSPDPGVAAWLAEVDEDRVFISVITLAEVRYGVARLPAGRRRDRLDRWVRHELPLRFENRVLSIDAAIADAWGEITARASAAGRPIHAMDAFIAATAVVHVLAIVTHDATDFTIAGAPAIDPWKNADQGLD